MKNICFKLNRKLVLTFALLMCLTLPGFAQKITVHGYVDDDLGEPLIGATVMEKGTTNGTATDIDGNFTLNVDPNATLVVSYVGYDPMEVAVNGRTDIKITMQQNAQMLAETVVIGYGSVKKSDATGSVAVITPDDIEAGISTSVQDMLVGASPGVTVTTDGGNPAGGATIRIRGGSSLTESGNDPLIVIDGVPQNNMSQGSGMSPMTMLNPADIESMTILKDASATAIYGSRASNGVIIITTKKGKTPKPQVNFAANFSVNTPRKTLKVMNADKFIQTVKQYSGEGTVDQLGYNGVMYNTDWQKEILRTSFSQDYALSVGGRAGNFPYRVNVGYTNNQGILKTSSMDRVNVGFSLNPKFFNDLLSINANANGTYARQNNADQSSIGNAISFDPTKPVRNNIPIEGGTGLYLYNGFYNLTTSTGTFNTNATYNPVQLLEDVNSYNDTFSSTGNLQIDYALHFLPELHLNLNLGYQVSKNDARSTTAANSLMAWQNSGLQSNGAAGAETLYKWHEIQRNTLLDFYINYKKEFEAIKSNLDVMVGYSWQKFSYLGHSQTYVNSLGFVNANGDPGFSYNDGTYYMTQSTHDAIGEVAGYAQESRWAAPLQLISFFGRLNYIFDDTYLLTFTLRDDASSRFDKSHRWGLFPSVALGWKINNVGSLRDVDWMNELKLRLGWGETGQQNIGGYFPYLPVYSISNQNNYQYPGYYPGTYYGEWISPLYPNAYNTNIKWETTTTWNVGIDFGVLNNRLTFNFDWYLRNTRDLLAFTPAKGANTAEYIDQNIGKLRNYGLEFTIGAKPVYTDNFIWNTGLNIAWNRNEITELNDGKPMVARGLVGGGVGGDLQWFVEGQPAYVYRVYQQVYDSDGNPLEGQYVDQNGDGQLDDSDLIYFHSPDPKVTISWNNNFSWKNWDLGITLRANLGNYVYNGNLRARSNTSSIDQYGLHNLIDNVFLFHQPTTTFYALSDYFVENASFLRCDNITLGYTWPNLCNDHLKLRLFGAVQNPFVITKYKGIDPEVFSGCDDNVYPRPVTFTLGLVATF